MTNKNELNLVVDNTKEEILSKETFQREINELLEKINNMIYSEQTLDLLKINTEKLLIKYMKAKLLDDRIRFEYETTDSAYGVFVSLKLLFEDKTLYLEKIGDLFNISDHFYAKDGNKIEYYENFNKFEVSIDKSTFNKDLEYMLNKAIENGEIANYRYRRFWIDKIKECIQEYQRLCIINQDIEISTRIIDKDDKINFYYNKNELYLEKYDDIFDFCKDEYRYIEDGKILNIKDKYEPIYKVDGNKLMIAGRVSLDEYEENISIVNRHKSQHIVSLIERFLNEKGVETENSKYDDEDLEDAFRGESILVPNVSISMYVTDEKMTYNEVIEKQILASIGELDIYSEYFGYSEYTIEGPNLENFSLVNEHGGKHDFVNIFNLLNGKYVHFILELVGRETNKKDQG